MPRREMTEGRVRVEPSWPSGGMVSRELDDRNWEVQQFTGYGVSTVSAGRWDRGKLERGATPVFKSSQLGLHMYDPTMPIHSEGQWRPRFLRRRKAK